MEANATSKLVDEIVKCAIGADVNKNLQYLLKLNMPAPNIAILRQAMHTSIRSVSHLRI